MVLDAGWSVVVDAAFLKRHERDSFRALAAERGADFAILACSAPLDEMRHRLETRQHDASEATVEVLERQLDWVEPWLPTKPRCASRCLIQNRAGAAPGRKLVIHPGSSELIRCARPTSSTPCACRSPACC
jgi:predicted kinase